MIRILTLVATIFIFGAASSFAGGFDDDTNKRVPIAIPPTSAGGAEAIQDVAAAAPPAEEVVVTTTPMPLLMRKVSVLIESTPSNSDIEVDGVYIGSTPVQVSMKEGVHHMQVAKEGFLPWARTVKAYNGLYVNATLVQESSTKSESTRSAITK